MHIFHLFFLIYVTSPLHFLCKMLAQHPKNNPGRQLASLPARTAIRYILVRRGGHSTSPASTVSGFPASGSTSSPPCFLRLAAS